MKTRPYDVVEEAAELPPQDPGLEDWEHGKRAGVKRSEYPPIAYQLLIALGVIAAWPACSLPLMVFGVPPGMAFTIGFFPAAWLIGAGLVEGGRWIASSKTASLRMTSQPEPKPKWHDRWHK